MIIQKSHAHVQDSVLEKCQEPIQHYVSCEFRVHDHVQNQQYAEIKKNPDSVRIEISSGMAPIGLEPMTLRV